LPIADIVSDHTRAEKILVDKQEIELKKASQQWFPRVGFHAGYRRFDGDQSNGNRTSKGAYYGGFIEVPFPTAGVSHALRVAQLDLEAAEFNLRHAEERERNRIVGLLRRANEVETRVLLLQDLLRAKQREVEAHRASYELGKLTVLDMNLVESSVVDTEQQYYDGLFDYTVAVFELNNIGDPGIPDASAPSSP
jgi:outer membrane protein TolC